MQMQNKFSLILRDSGNNPTRVTKLIRKITNCDEKKGLSILNHTPSIIKKNVSFSEVKELEYTFQKLGALVEIKIYVSPLKNSYDAFKVFINSNVLNKN